MIHIAKRKISDLRIGIMLGIIPKISACIMIIQPKIFGNHPFRKMAFGEIGNVTRSMLYMRNFHMKCIVPLQFSHAIEHL